MSVQDDMRAIAAVCAKGCYIDDTYADGFGDIMWRGYRHVVIHFDIVSASNNIDETRHYINCMLFSLHFQEDIRDKDIPYGWTFDVEALNKLIDRVDVLIGEYRANVRAILGGLLTDEIIEEIAEYIDVRAIIPLDKNNINYEWAQTVNINIDAYGCAYPDRQPVRKILDKYTQWALCDIERA